MVLGPVVHQVLVERIVVDQGRDAEVNQQLISDGFDELVGMATFGKSTHLVGDVMSPVAAVVWTPSRKRANCGCWVMTALMSLTGTVGVM
jgi:hypothetical protein